MKPKQEDWIRRKKTDVFQSINIGFIFSKCLEVLLRNSQKQNRLVSCSKMSIKQPHHVSGFSTHSFTFKEKSIFGGLNINQVSRGK